MREAAPHRSNMKTDMSTDNRGTILAWERGTRAGEVPGNAGRPGRNAFQEPAEFIVGPHGRVGGNDPMNTNDADGDFDAGPWGDADLQMPFKSEQQRRFLWSQHPDIAEAWAHGKSSVTGRKESRSQQGKRKRRSSQRGGRKSR